MSGSGLSDSTADPPRRGGPGDDGALRLLIFADGVHVVTLLPNSGEVTIGRAPEARVRLSDASISRMHARLTMSSTIEGTKIEVEDLGSANGTSVRGQRLAVGERATIAPWELVDLGATTMLVQSNLDVGRHRRLWRPTDFEERLAEECERARTTGGSFALVDLFPETNDAGAQLEDLIWHTLRPMDVVGRDASGGYRVILLDVSASESQTLIAALTDRLKEKAVRATWACARFPEDGRRAEDLSRLSRSKLSDDYRQGADGPVVLSGAGAMKGVLDLIDRVAKTDMNVLLLGETGVGKEIFAEEIHKRSRRSAANLLRLGCASLSETLLEHELFGFEKDAVPGASESKPGLLEINAGGSVLLDEVADLPLSIQGKLLRVLEHREVRRIGGAQQRSIDVRFISTSNRGLEAEAARGCFRQDLLFRLSAVSIVIPPLRERVEEILPLASAFARAQRGDAVTFEPAAEALLVGYSWPGNVRELKSVIGQAVLIAEGRPIAAEHLPTDRLRPQRPRGVPHRKWAKISGDIGSGEGDAASVLPPAVPKELERIIEAMERCGGNQTRAADMLGISRGTLQSRLDEYGIPRPKKSGPPRSRSKGR